MSWRAFLLMTLAAGGCTNAPAAEELQLQEQDSRWSPAFASIPDARPLPPGPAADEEIVQRPGQPWITVGRCHGNADEYWSDGVDDDAAAGCPFSVQAIGFPIEA